MNHRYEHDRCPDCGAGLELEVGRDPEQYCVFCLVTEQSEEINRQRVEIGRLREIIKNLGGELP
jgi:hypothetical protein